MSVLTRDISKHRAIARGGSRSKYIEQWLAELSEGGLATTFTSGDASPSVRDGARFITAGTTTITNFDDGDAGQTITVKRGASAITIANNSNIVTLTGDNLALTDAQQTATFWLISGVWYQVQESQHLSKLQVGADPDIDSSAPGALALNVTTSSAATAATPYQFGGQVYLGINPASASSTIFRGLYVRSETLTDSDITEMIGFSAYQYHNRAGTVPTQYGGTLQTRNFGSGNITSAQGALCAVRGADGSTGAYNLGRGATASAISDTTAGVTQFADAVGLYATARITGNGTITDGSAVEGEILLEASGGAMPTARAGYFHGTIAAGATVTNLFGARIALSNSGTVTNYYGLYLAGVTGTAPASNFYAIYAASTGQNYLAGNLGVGHTTPTEGSVVIEQGSNSAGLYVLRTSDDANGVQITTDANSASPAANDILLTLTAQGRDSGANATNYAQMKATLVTATDTSEAGRWSFITYFAGASATRVRIGGGLYDGGTNDQGIGTCNMLNGYYVGDNLVINPSRGIKLRSYADTAIAAIGNAVNTADKAAGVMVWDNVNHRIMVAAGSATNDKWYVADGSANVTPA